MANMKNNYHLNYKFAFRSNSVTSENHRQSGGAKIVQIRGRGVRGGRGGG
jgi:hypothetical protein